MRRDAEPPDPYAYGLAALARRELTERQLRDRLRRRGCDADAIDAAIARLEEHRVLDDARTARAFARTEARIKRRGPNRIRRTLELMGIDKEGARTATAEGFEQRPVQEALDEALRRKLRGPVTDARQGRRLVAYLVRQGFDVSESVAAVRRASRALDASE